jgi:aryl-alcohol dehydrogenase-like predicted oxidoreductase
MSDWRQAARDELAAKVAEAQAALASALAADPAWGTLPGVTLPADLDGAVAAADAWLSGVILPWVASIDGLLPTLPSVRVPGQS